MSDKLSWSNYDFAQIPFDKIISLGQRTLLYRDLFTVSWLLGRYCNYKCSYCWPYAHTTKKDHRSTELCLKTIDEIKRQARNNGFNSFHFSLSGGEPTFHPGYLDILKPRPIPVAPDDVLYEILPSYTYRPDLLAFDLYGRKELWWVFAQRNVDIIKDPIFDFVAGTKIYLPQGSKLKTSLGI